MAALLLCQLHLHIWPLASALAFLFSICNFAFFPSIPLSTHSNKEYRKEFVYKSFFPPVNSIASNLRSKQRQQNDIPVRTMPLKVQSPTCTCAGHARITLHPENSPEVLQLVSLSHICLRLLKATKYEWGTEWVANMVGHPRHFLGQEIVREDLQLVFIPPRWHFFHMSFGFKKSICQLVATE